MRNKEKYLKQKVKVAIVHDFQRSRLDLWPGNNPQKDFDYGIEAMIKAYKEVGHTDYMIVYDGLMWDVATSSQFSFPKEVEEKLNTAGIDVFVEAEVYTTEAYPKGVSRIVESIKQREGLDTLIIDTVDIHYDNDKALAGFFYRSCKNLKNGRVSPMVKGAVGYKLTKKI